MRADGLRIRVDQRQNEPEPVALRFVHAAAWYDGGSHKVGKPGREAETLLRQATANQGAVWLELGLPEMSDTARAWFEGSLNVWEPDPRPHVEWGEVRSLIEALEFAVPAQVIQEDEPPTSALLRVLPHVYGRGIFRALRDVLVLQKVSADATYLFPTLGFRPTGANPAESFWTIRLNVGVVERAVITIRLPDHLSGGGDSESERQSSGVAKLEIPGRFFPFRAPQAPDIAEAIAHHQAATARAVTETLRDDLNRLQDTLGDESPAEAEERATASDAQEKVVMRLAPTVTPDRRQEIIATRAAITEKRELLYELKRQVARLLRRYGSYGERDQARDEFVPREVKPRYGYAMDELDLLREDYRLLDERASKEAGALEQEERERLQFVAALLATVVLIPTLVAGIAGTSVELPGPDANGFPALVLFLVASAAFGLYIINEAWNRTWRPRTDVLTRPNLRLLPLGLSLLCIFAAVAYLVIVA